MVIPRTVYAIQHNKTKRIYVGSSAKVEQRYWQHIYDLRGGKHTNEEMQKDFDEYGEDYSVYLLEEVTDYGDRTKEYEWMQRLGTCDKDIGYNFKEQEKAISKLGLQVPIKEGYPTPLTKSELERK